MLRWLHNSRRIAAATLLNLALGLAIPSAAQEEQGAVPFDHQEALEKSRAAVGNQLSGYTLTNTDGMPFHLESLRDKPLIINLVYTSCYHICQMTTQNLKKMVEIANDSLGPDKFNVVTIGFDTRIDSPEMMAEYARSRSIDFENWMFLSGDSDTIGRLVDEVGFSYIPTSKGFEHVLQATMVDQQGVIYTQVYGESYDAPRLMEPLKELVYKRPVNRSIIANIEDRVRFFCTVYDPASGEYRFDYSLFVGMAVGFTIILFILYFLVKEFVVNPRKRGDRNN